MKSDLDRWILEREDSSIPLADGVEFGCGSQVWKFFDPQYTPTLLVSDRATLK